MDSSEKIYNDRAEVIYYLNPGQAQVEILSDGERIIKPGMKSVFIEDDNSVTVEDGMTVKGSYCSCNSVTVCTCNMVCTCEAVCSCVGNCTCNQVCTCNNHCSCDSVCTCLSNCTCLSVGGTTYCSCVPVH